MPSFQMPTDVEPSNFLTHPGQYHAMILSAAENPPRHDGSGMVDGAVFELQILDGTVPAEKKKMFRATLPNPNMSHRDGGDFALRRQARMAIVTGLVSPADLGKNVSFDWGDARGRQIVLTVKESESTKTPGKKYLDIDGLHVYAVTDPAVAHVPKDVTGLKLLGLDPTKLPKPDNAGQAAGNGNGNVAGNGTGNGSQAGKSSVAPPIGGHPAKGATIPPPQPAGMPQPVAAASNPNAWNL